MCVFDDNEDDFFVYFECVCVCGEKGVEQSRRQRNGVLFVCIGELSRIE